MAVPGGHHVPGVGGRMNDLETDVITAAMELLEKTES